MPEISKLKIKYTNKYSADELDKYADEQMELIRQDKDVYKEIQNMGVKTSQVRDYLAFFIDYKDDYNICKGCKGCKDCHKKNKYMRIQLTVDDGRVSRHTCLCDYAIEMKKLLGEFSYHDFPDEWVLAGFNERDLLFLKTRTEVLNRCANIIERKNNDWIYLYGNKASGKSYILVTLINSLNKIGRGPAAVIDCSTEIKSLQDELYDMKSKFDEDFNTLCTTPILLLDNFGEGSRTEYVRDSIIMPLLSARSRNNLLTLFTSTFSIEEIGELYSVGKGSTASSRIIGKQLVRLLEDETNGAVEMNDKPVFKVK